MVKIAPSILAADFAHLANDIRDVEQKGADWLHVDIMDGHFVPNISMGPMIMEAIRPHTSLPLDVHLMIEKPEHYIPSFAENGAETISVHQEACPHLHRTIYQIKELGCRAGVVLNPATPVEMIKPVLTDVDLILFMTVNPGYGGQRFIPSVLPKIETCRAWLNELALTTDIQVDGGIDTETGVLCKQAGANVLVAGTAIFKAEDRQKMIQQLRTL